MKVKITEAHRGEGAKTVKVRHETVILLFVTFTETLQNAVKVISE